MVYKRPKVKYAPKQWRGVFPAIVIAFIAVSVGALMYITPAAYGLVTTTAANSYLGQVASAQATYYDQHGRYASKDTELAGNIRPGVGLTGGIVDACSTGWVAYAASSLGHIKLYASSLTTTPTDLTQLKLPSCVTVEALSGTTLDYTVKIANVKVVRATKTGAETLGATSPTKTLQGATVTWDATNSCSKTETPTYQVRVTRQAITPQSKQYPADPAGTPATYTTTAKTLTVSNMVNGLTYAFDISGQCGTNYPSGKATTVKFTQALPTPNGVIAQWDSGKGVLRPFYGMVSGSSYVHYTLQVETASEPSWHTLLADIDPADMNQYHFNNYSANYGDRYRIRAFTLDGSAESPWSTSSAVRFTSSYSGYYYGY